MLQRVPFRHKSRCHPDQPFVIIMRAALASFFFSDLIVFVVVKIFFGCVLYFNSALRREASTSLRLTHPFCPATSACLISFELVGQGDQAKPKVT